MGTNKYLLALRVVAPDMGQNILKIEPAYLLHLASLVDVGWIYNNLSLPVCNKLCNKIHMPVQDRICAIEHLLKGLDILAYLDI